LAKRKSDSVNYINNRKKNPPLRWTQVLKDLKTERPLKILLLIVTNEIN